MDLVQRAKYSIAQFASNYAKSYYIKTMVDKVLRAYLKDKKVDINLYAIETFYY